MKNNIIAMQRSASTGSTAEPVATDPLAELLAERVKLEAELARLGVVDQRLAEAEGKLAEVGAGIQALDRADVEQMRAWAEAGEGEAPRPLVEERRALLGRQLDAQAEVEGARNAVAAVGNKRMALAAKIGGIDRARWLARLDASIAEAGRLHAEAIEIAAKLAEPMMNVAGLRAALVDLVRTLPAGEMQQRAGAAIERLDAFPKPVLAGEAAAAERFAHAWRERLR